MKNKTEVEIKSDSVYGGEYKAGDKGYIDGYVRGGDNTPYACVVVENKHRVYMIPLHCLYISKSK